MSPRPRVLRWGPYPHEGGVFGGGIGGYARYNSQAQRSFLAEAFDLQPLPMTVPRFRNAALARAHLPWRFVADVVTIARALVRGRADMLHVTGLYWRSIYREAGAVWIARRLGTPVLYDARAGTFEEFVLRGPPLQRRLARYVLQNACRVAVQGRAVATTVGETFGIDAEWLPNCFLDEDLDAHPAAELREPRGGEPFRIAYVGYLIPDKGVDVLLEAAHRLSRLAPVEVTLMGVVAPRFRATLERFQALASPSFRIVVTGRLSLEAILSRLRVQHVFVFLSRFFGEGQPNAVTEAMAIGLPIVCTRQGFLGDLVGEECGVMIDDPRGVDAVVEALDDLRNDWPRLVRMGGCARERVAEAFSESVVLGRTAAVYRACIDDDAEDAR